MRNRASASDKARNRSRKSWFTGIPSLEPPDLLAQPPRLGEPLVRADARPELHVEAIVHLSIGGLPHGEAASHHESVAGGGAPAAAFHSLRGAGQDRRQELYQVLDLLVQVAAGIGAVDDVSGPAVEGLGGGPDGGQVLTGRRSASYSPFSGGSRRSRSQSPLRLTTMEVAMRTSPGPVELPHAESRY